MTARVESFISDWTNSVTDLTMKSMVGEDLPSPSSGSAVSVTVVAVQLEKLSVRASASLDIADDANDVTHDGKLADDDGGAGEDDDDGDDGTEEECEDDDGSEKKEKKEGDVINGMKKKKKKEMQKGVANEDEGSISLYPQRPDEPDCAYYMKKGACKYGMNCRYNHPFARGCNDHQVPKGKEALPERVGQPECKYYLKTGTCKFGGACRYNHPREKDGTGGKLELNFLGLPIRMGEKECLFYMRTGSCKYATNCKFHHPDPTTIGACIPVSGYHGGGSFPIHPSSTSLTPATTWPLQRNSNNSGTSLEASPPYVPVMLPPHPAVLPISGWNSFPAPFGQMLPPVAATMNEQAARLVDYSTNLHHQEPLEDFPERPGQPECQYYLKTGTCKFRSQCRYHHPKSMASKPPMCPLSPMGLPLRPDQTVCVHYSRFGICKFGPACKFNHPPTYGYQGLLAASVNGQSQATDPSSVENGRNISHSNGNVSSKASCAEDAVGITD